jgi:hypothetical protein
MSEKLAIILLKDNIKHHGVDDVWEAHWHEEKESGLCNQETFVISMNKEFVKSHNYNEILNMIHHELAHTDMPIGYGHGEKWTKNYKKIKRSWQQHVYQKRNRPQD